MKFYRLNSHLGYANCVNFFMDEFNLVKETKCGYWIDHYDKKKWIGKWSKKRFAYPTQREAINGFKYRKKKQIEILTNQLILARLSLQLILCKNFLKDKGWEKCNIKVDDNVSF